MPVSASRPAPETVGEVAIIPLDIGGFEELEFPDRIAAAYYARAARAGDRIFFDQRNRFHLPMLSLIEDIVAARPALPGNLLDRLTGYLKRLWLHRGNHYLDSTLKFLPDFTAGELERAARQVGSDRISLPAGMDLEAVLRQLEPAIFDDGFEAQLTCKSPPAGQDVVTASAINYYEGLTEAEVRGFPALSPLNSRLARRDGRIVEEIWRAGGEGYAPGRYAAALTEVIRCLEAARAYADPDQAAYLQALVRYLRTGQLTDFEQATRSWVAARPAVDLILGFIEQYHDPLGHRGEFEGTVHMVDRAHAWLMNTLAREAEWFESRMPWDPRWSRTRIQATRAEASNILSLSGSSAPFGYIGINLPNDVGLRAQVGSKSFLIRNLMRLRRAIGGDAWIRELSATPEDLASVRAHGARAIDLLVALHEVIGHSSGAVSPALQGPPEDHLRELYNTLEEARADLVAGWHLPDPRLAEIGIVDGPAVVLEGYREMLRRAYVTISMLEHPLAEEDHDRGDLLIVHYLLEQRAGIRQIRRDDRSYLVLDDVEAMRAGIGRLLAEVMRIKAEGDYEAGKRLIERYGVHVDPSLHQELRARAAQLGIPSRVAFINPLFELKKDPSGVIVDVEVRYPEDFMQEQLELSRTWRQLGRC